MDKEWTFLNTFQFSGVFPWTKSLTSQGQENRTATPTHKSSGSCKASAGYAVDATNKGGDALLTQLHLQKPLAGRLYQDLGYPEALIRSGWILQSWICFDEIWFLKTISLSHHGAGKHDNPLSSHVDTFKGSFNSSVPQSVVTRPKGPHQVGKSRRAASNFHPSPATQNLNTTLPYFIHWFAAWTSTHTSVSASHTTITTTTNST